MSHRIPWRHRLALVVVLTLASAAAAWLTSATHDPRRPASAPTGALVLALAGDAAISVPLDVDAPGLRAVAGLAQRASLAIANFELSIAPAAAPGAELGAPRWPSATDAAAEDLRRLGIGAVSLANNHALDFGADGLSAVQARLAAAGVAAAGAGANLEAARAPAFVETPAGTVALVSVAVSFSPGARAAPRQGDILGRPGVNGLRYARHLTVDAASFEGLAAAFPPPAFTANPDGRTWNLLGITVERGARGGMALVPDREDLAALAASVREARATAAAVVVSLHAHEPGNRLDDVPDLLREVAHAAIDAGADVVHGHGPHRLRGIEVYRGRPVFYSLGNFVFPDRALTAPAADGFEDAAMNVLSPVGAEGPPIVDFSDDAWWQSAIALVRVEGGRVSRVELHPLDVGVGQDRRVRGIPAPAGPMAATAILARLRELSAPLGTTVTVVDGIGVVTSLSH